jgi:hypothetical protein
MGLTVEKPRTRNNSGQFSARGIISAALLRKAYAGPRRGTAAKSAPAPAPGALMFAAKGYLVEFDATTSKPENVDRVNGIIRGVSVITSGVIARGHDLEVDSITLQQMQKCAEDKVQVPVKVDHKSGAAAVCGFLCNFRQDDTKLLADWHLLASHPQRDQILEVAERMPRGVGLSAAFVAPEKPGRTATGAKAARCEELISVDYVTLPAANPNGMFDAKVDTHPNAMNPEIIAAIEAAIAKAVAPLAAQITDQAKQLNLVTNPPTLEQVAQMDEAQLAELGLTPEDVQAALEGLEGQEGEVAPEGEVAAQTEVAPATEAAAVTAGAPTAASFAALTKQVTELSAKLVAKELKVAKDAEEVLFADTEAKIENLIARNVALEAALKTGGKALSPSTDRNGIKFFSANSAKGQFENLVQFHVEDGKLTKSKAFSAAIKENPEAYQDYLVRLGVHKAE